MNRRKFVASLGAATVTAGAMAPPATASPLSVSEASDRGGRGASDFDPVERSIADLQAAQARGAVSAESLTSIYLRRIEQLDRRGPMLGSVLAVNPDALAAARGLDRERAQGRLRGPLHGIPMLLKDNIETRDPLPTTAGSLALAGARHSQDSPVAARLRAAGAVILGKANLSEWANFRSTRSCSGWSAVGGQTRCPYQPARNPSGSSAGPAAAASASLCAAAIGTETDGSVLAPASINGLVGLKPTVGLVSSAGIVPISSRQDTAGPMTRSVADAALLLSVMAPARPDWEGVRLPLEPAPRGLKLGVMRPPPSTHPLVERESQQWLKLLEREGFTLVDVPMPRQWPELGDLELEVLLYDFKAEIDAYLARLGGAVPVRTLADLIEFNRAHAHAEMPYFGQELFEQAQACGPRSSPVYRKALRRLLDAADTHGLAAIFSRHQIDALVAPGNGPAELIDHVWGDRFEDSGGWPPMCSAAAVAGYPSLTVPAGMVDGLPVGIAFVARRLAESTLLRIGLRFEQAMQGRR
ncbi:MAG TPA: amidase, partial [Steroidobacteraceae bacterium]|nr:amidase [Steroidobacteraceae bacterium]